MRKRTFSMDASGVGVGEQAGEAFGEDAAGATVAAVGVVLAAAADAGEHRLRARATSTYQDPVVAGGGVGDRAQFEALERDLIAEIKAEEDNLRFYRIAELRGYEVKEHGCFRATDFDAPLIL